VLADLDGPGCIRRIWVTGGNIGRDVVMRMTFDGATVPHVEAPLPDFFGVMLGVATTAGMADTTAPPVPTGCVGGMLSGLSFQQGFEAQGGGSPELELLPRAQKVDHRYVAAAPRQRLDVGRANDDGATDTGEKGDGQRLCPARHGLAKERTAVGLPGVDLRVVLLCLDPQDFIGQDHLDLPGLNHVGDRFHGGNGGRWHNVRGDGGRMVRERGDSLQGDGKPGRVDGFDQVVGRTSFVRFEGMSLRGSDDDDPGG
jgi:hypothetical protein